jgi:HPt (histidine-containing phosphotransfer) domain-containing protein
LGHDLKGTAGAFGFQAVSDLASELEKALVRGDLVEAEDTLERLIDYLDRTAVVPG